ncbi:hypothetical protein FQA39_LY01260 [Lamprigera yunnana]|nr:hypothetical protein FQA39_LY01260 [Lamprigera yunnana]
MEEEEEKEKMEMGRKSNRNSEKVHILGIYKKQDGHIRERAAKANRMMGQENIFEADIGKRILIFDKLVERRVEIDSGRSKEQGQQCEITRKDNKDMHTAEVRGKRWKHLPKDCEQLKDHHRTRREVLAAREARTTVSNDATVNAPSSSGAIKFSLCTRPAELKCMDASDIYCVYSILVYFYIYLSYCIGCHNRIFGDRKRKIGFNEDCVVYVDDIRVTQGILENGVTTIMGIFEENKLFIWIRNVGIKKEKCILRISNNVTLHATISLGSGNLDFWECD